MEQKGIKNGIQRWPRHWHSRQIRKKIEKKKKLKVPPHRVVVVVVVMLMMLLKENDENDNENDNFHEILALHRHSLYH